MTVATCDFGPLTVAYDERVLTPRPWTLLQSRWAAELSPELPDGPILELCAGAGHIGLAAAVLTGRPLVQVECDPTAAAFATRNARAAGVRNHEMRVTTIDAATFVGETFPLILADPPYLPTADVERFPDDPRRAIDGGRDGLTYVRTCIAIAALHLAAPGALLLQLRGPAQANSVGARTIRAHDDERAVALLTRNEIERCAIG
ncbi:MAG TPA: methyltransferase [Acidimicrobiales bacterium]|nr:methyltransferase [Acidimicrobiales bacterium]